MRYTLNRPGDGRTRAIALSLAIAFHLAILLFVLLGGPEESAWMPDFINQFFSGNAVDAA